MEEEWYKCDQFDGLIELLKDKKIVDDEKHLKLYKESFDTYQNKNLTEDGWYDVIAYKNWSNDVMFGVLAERDSNVLYVKTGTANGVITKILEG